MQNLKFSLIMAPFVVFVSAATMATSVVSQEQVLDTFERPEFANEGQWKSSVKRTILSGQVTSFVLRSKKPCLLVGTPGLRKMQAVNIKKASAPGYRTGIYYDALPLLTADNCKDAKYLQIDASHSMQVGDVQITVVTKTTKAPAVPRVQLDVEFNNWVMVQAYCGGVGKYCNVESKGLQGMQMLKDHRISVYKGYPGPALPWNTYVLPFNFGDLFAGAGPAPGDLKSMGVQSRPKVAYVRDEPKYDTYDTLLAELRAWKAADPSVKRKVTMPIRPRDLNPKSSTYGKVIDLRKDIRDLIDVYQPVAEEFCVETWPGSKDMYPCEDAYVGKELGLYISNMSNGAEDGPATGAPDLVIDRSAVESFGFFLMGLKYGQGKLLYYNSIEGWEKAKAKDVWKDPYQFGGAGDGLLLYPDWLKREAVPSIRLKLLREASNFADIVAAAKMETQAKTLMKNPLKWDHDLKKFEKLRAEALKAVR